MLFGKLGITYLYFFVRYMATTSENKFCKRTVFKYNRRKKQKFIYFKTTL